MADRVMLAAASRLLPRPDDPQRTPLLLDGVHLLQLPDNDEAGDDLDQQVEPEPGERCDGCREHKHGADDIPAERRILQPQPALT
jgi:hypothetical protein